MSSLVVKRSAVVENQQQIDRQMDKDEKQQENPGDTHQKFTAN
jgi:hypothetical protein